MTQSDVRHGCDVYPHVVGKALDGLDAMSTDAAPSDWMQLHIAAEVAAIDAAPEPKVQPLDVAQWQLSPWAKWVAADDGGVVWEYKSQPVILAGNHIKRWWPSDGWAKAIGTIDLTGIDWRRTLTPVNVEPARGILPGLTGGERSEVVQRRLRGYADEPADAIPGDVAAALFSQHGDAWCSHLVAELITLLDADMVQSMDAERHQRIWDSIEAQLRVAQ